MLIGSGVVYVCLTSANLKSWNTPAPYGVVEKVNPNVERLIPVPEEDKVVHVMSENGCREVPASIFIKQGEAK